MVQLLHVSPLLQDRSPQKGHTPQSVGQEEQVSPLLAGRLRQQMLDLRDGPVGDAAVGLVGRYQHSEQEPAFPFLAGNLAANQAEPIAAVDGHFIFVCCD